MKPHIAPLVKRLKKVQKHFYIALEAGNEIKMKQADCLEAAIKNRINKFTKKAA